ncbi:hypothetical protein [Echinicola soli]|nr:hypothetical protein [Echinicola soli]
MFQVIVKLTFLASLMPYLLSEKIYNKYQVRINPQVVDTLYYSGKEVGGVDRKLLKEASGLAVSRIHENVLYTHNDSGGKPTVYKLDSTGNVTGKITLDNTFNRDWEDIAVGPDAGGMKSYVYVGEIGDNDGEYPSISLLKFEEPAMDSTDLHVQPEKIKLKYPDGARDAETLMVDPWNGDVYIVSKRDSSNVLYRAPADKLDEEEVELEPLQNLPITMSVAGDISPDGKEIIIKNYWVIYYWTRKEGESIAEALSRKPVQLPYVPEPQGEAIAFSKNGHSFFSLSEERFRIKPVLYQYYKK